VFIIDSHLDLSMNALLMNRDLTKTVEQIRQREVGMPEPGRALGTVTLPAMRDGSVGLCLGTVIARVKEKPGGTARLDYASPEIAYAMAQGQLAYYRMLARQGELRLISNLTELDAHVADWQTPTESSAQKPIGLVLAMEGADCIVTPDQTEAWWNDGLRVISLSHYGVGRYAYGTETEGGVTPLGRELLKEMGRLGIILDVTHLADQAFWEVLSLFPGPIMASHNNCRSLVPGQRQFSDEQIKAIVARNGVIGVAMDAWMLYPSWIRGKTQNSVVSMENVADHVEHICQLAGNADHVAIGTDLDGGYGYEQTPNDLHSIADLSKLLHILERRGFTQSQVENVANGNWLRTLRGAWKD
jgi:membrane dipeptidase